MNREKKITTKRRRTDFNANVSSSDYEKKHLISAVVLTQTLWEIVVSRSTSVTSSSDDVRLATALASIFIAAE